MKNKLIRLGVAFMAMLLIGGASSTVFAAKLDKGVDQSKFNGNQGKFGYPSDKFSISQIGGYYDGSFVDQYTYATQVQYTIAQGKRAHTYIYAQFSSREQADVMLDHYLPNVQTPKGSIVALDVESGNPNTEAVRYALDRVQKAGYTAVLYGYKNFLTSHLDLNSLADAYPLWMAEYPDYNVTPEPNYNYFPSFKNIAIFQFTSTYVAGGLDGNIDLTGITDNGYTKNNKPETDTPAIDAGHEADNTPKKDIKVGDTVKVNFGASKYATGETIPGYVKGQPHKVLQVSGTRVLLADIYSWVERSDVEILDVSGNPGGNGNRNVSTGNTSGTTKDGQYTIHNENGVFTANESLAVWNYPGISNTGVRYYPGESVSYFGYVRNGNYIYGAYHRNNGLIGYIAVRNAVTGQPLGSFR